MGVFDHFEGLAPKELKILRCEYRQHWLFFNIMYETVRPNGLQKNFLLLKLPYYRLTLSNLQRSNLLSSQCDRFRIFPNRNSKQKKTLSA